jgi:DNA replication protein DnaC
MTTKILPFLAHEQVATPTQRKSNLGNLATEVEQAATPTQRKSNLGNLATEVEQAAMPTQHNFVQGNLAMLQAALAAPPSHNEPLEPPVSAPKTQCPDCYGFGFYKLAVRATHPDFGKLFRCECKLAEHAHHAERRRQEILEQLADELGHLRHKRLSNFDTRHPDPLKQRNLRNALAAAEDYVQRGFAGWLYIWGDCNAGKSHLAAGIALAAADAGLRVSYASVPTLLRFLRAGFSDGSSDQRLMALQIVDVLVLDDLGAEYHRGGGYDYTDAVLFELLNARQITNRATVITSNFPALDHETRLSARIRRASREVLIETDDYLVRTKALEVWDRGETLC